MKEIILSADASPSVYLVPDEVADNLRQFCLDFISWLRKSPDAKKLRISGGVCYNEKDFIDYLNTWVFPNSPSVLVKSFNLGYGVIPDEYKHLEWFNF